MLISLTFTYLENFFVVFYLSFYFILAQDASTRARQGEILKGGSGVLGVCDGQMVEVEEVDDGLGGRGPGLWGLLSPSLAPSVRRTGARGPFAGWWAFGWAWWGEALAPFRGDFPGALGAPVGPVLG